MYKYKQIFYKRKRCKEKTVYSTGKIKGRGLLEMREIIGNFAKREVRLYGCYL